MPKISADYNRILSAAGEFKAQSERITQIRDDIQNIMNQIPLETTFFTAAKTRMLMQCISLAGISQKYKRIGSSLEEIDSLYKKADQNALDGKLGFGNIPDFVGKIPSIFTGPFITDTNGGFDGSVRWSDISSDIMRRLANSHFRNIIELADPNSLIHTNPGMDLVRNFVFPTFGIGAIATTFPALIGAGIALTPSMSASGELEVNGIKIGGNFDYKTGEGKGGWFQKNKVKPEQPFKNLNDKIEDSLKSEGLLHKKSWNSDSEKQGLYDPDASEKYSKEELENRKAANKFMKREAELEVFGGKLEGSVIDAKGSIKGDYGSLEGEVKVLNGEVHAGAGIGEFVTKDANGKTHHGVGAYAEMGGSVSALEGEVVGRVGTENFGGYVKADGKVLSAEATAGGAAGFINGKPQVYVGGKAEALIAEGSVSGGVTVAGADVGVKATGKVGVSASANVGFKDGHVVADLGLAVGVGGEISLDIDLNKPMENIINASGDIQRFAEDAGRNIQHFAEDTGRNIQHFAEDTGRNLQNFAEDTGRNISNFTQGAAEGAKEFFGSIFGR